MSGAREGGTVVQTGVDAGRVDISSCLGERCWRDVALSSLAVEVVKAVFFWSGTTFDHPGAHYLLDLQKASAPRPSQRSAAKRGFFCTPKLSLVPLANVLVKGSPPKKPPKNEEKEKHRFEREKCWDYELCMYKGAKGRRDPRKVEGVHM